MSAAVMLRKVVSGSFKCSNLSSRCLEEGLFISLAKVPAVTLVAFAAAKSARELLIRFIEFNNVAEDDDFTKFDLVDALLITLLEDVELNDNVDRSGKYKLN